MAELRLDYYKGEDLYSDGDVEQELLRIAKAGIRPEDMEQADFPVLYHFSAIRENILNWYPFGAGVSCLEIGSGCGAITGLLCRRMERVVSVELSKRRAGINFERHRDFGNLEIWVGNLNDMQFGGEFDYVILNGVFEYAVSYTPGEDPCGTFLRNIRRFLKPDGVLLVAIENRLGLKYFAGAPEDHTNGYFDGIRNYENGGGARTFSRGEWETLMERCGFPHYKFYYPYPDYKFPQEIFTDRSLREQKYGRPTWNFTEYRMALFRETEMAGTLAEEGVMNRFANSFLIEMSAEPLRRDREVRYAKLSTDRAEEFAVTTVIEERSDGCVAVKRATSDTACAHIQRMLAQMDRSYGLWRPLSGTREDDGIVFPFLAQKSLGRQAEEAVRRGDLAAVKSLARTAAVLCGQGAGVRLPMSEVQQGEFLYVFGVRRLPGEQECIAPANIDLILDNIFEAEDGYRVIDCEWIFDFPVPVSFLVWRMINELYSVCPAMEELCPQRAFLEEFGITDGMAEVFLDWAAHFTEQYVGANRLLRFSRPEIGISIEEFRQRLRAQEYAVSQLFVDTGEGFSEAQKLSVESSIADGRLSLTFDLSRFEGVRTLRFDPVEGSPCICRIDEERTTGRLRAANAVARVPEGDLFLTIDPMYEVRTEKGAKSLTVCGEIRVLTPQEALKLADELFPRRRFPFLR